MTIKEAIEQVITGAPDAFTSDQVIDLIRSKGFVPKTHGNSALGKEIHEYIQTHCKDISYELSGRSGNCARYQRRS